MADDNTNPTPEGAGGGTVRDDVLAAFKEHNAPTETSFELPSERAPESAAPESETEQQKADRVRDEAGRFAKSDKPADKQTDKPAEAAPKKEAAPAKVVTNKITDQDNTAKATAAPSPAGEPPKGWSAEAKAEWSKLPPAIQTAVLKREQDMSDGGRQWSEEKRRYEELISPVREASTRRGINEAEGIKRLMAAQNALDTNPGNALRWLAQAYGVDLKQLATNPAYQAAPVARTQQQQQPDIASIVEQKLTERETLRTVESFAKDTDKYPHFEKVRNLMAALVESGAAETLENAYDMAVYADPTLRTEILTAQQSSAEAAKRQAEQERVAKAKTAAVSLRGSPNGTPAPAPKEFNDVRSAVVDAWQRHTARAS